MSKSEGRNAKTDRVSIIRAVQTPLGFFVLVVLVVEAIFGIVSGISTDAKRTWVVSAMILLIFTLVAIVAFMAYFRPEALRGERSATEPCAEDRPQEKTGKDDIVLRLEDLLWTKERDRVFGLFSREAFEICPITVRHIVENSIGRGASWNRETFLCVRRIIDLLEKDEYLKNIDYSRIADSRSALPNLGDKWSPCLPERDRYMSLRYPKPVYKGSTPPTGIPRDVICAWADMTALAKKIMIGSGSPFDLLPVL